jgi:hypothetical protein
VFVYYQVLTCLVALLPNQTVLASIIFVSDCSTRRRGRIRRRGDMKKT